MGPDGVAIAMPAAIVQLGDSGRKNFATQQGMPKILQESSKKF